MKRAFRGTFKKALMVGFSAFTLMAAYQNCSRGFQAADMADSNSFLSAGGPSPLFKEGSVLYANNCASCHGELAVSTKVNRSPQQIQSAIASVSSMAHLRGLSTADLNAIATALTKTTNALANPFTCNGDTGVSVLRRLTKREYSNTVFDLFQGQVSYADLQNELANLQPEFTNASPSVRVFDSTNPNSMTLPLLKAYNEIATKAADVITASATKMNAIGGTCISASAVTAECLNAFLDNFGLRAFRRPLTTTEKSTYLNLYNTGTSSPDRMARVIQALMLSPSFLYKLEINGSSHNGRTDLLRLSPFEIASRLSYSILGSMPDQALFDAAKSGALATEAGLQSQVERLFGLSKAKEGVRAFYSQWLRLDYIPDIQTTPALANGLNLATFKNDARGEIVDLMDHLIWTQKSNYKELMSTRLAVPKTVNLSTIYGVPVSSIPVTLNDPHRAGLLTRVGMLSLDPSGASNPIRRGVHVRVHMLCDPLGTPPADASMMAATYDPLSSTREQVASKTAAPNCMACHGRINPAGFAFENFDGLGRFRTQETVTHNGQTRTWPIDATVSPNLTSANDPSVNGAAELQAAMAETSIGQACMARQWLQYSTGRDAEANDGCALASMYDAGIRSGGSVLDMFKAYTQTQDFLLKKMGPMN